MPEKGTCAARIHRLSRPFGLGGRRNRFWHTGGTERGRSAPDAARQDFHLQVPPALSHRRADAAQGSCRLHQKSGNRARDLARSGIDAIQERLAKDGYEVARCALLLSSGRKLPALEQILASHALIHTADGELFREAIRGACAHYGLPIAGTKEKDLFKLAANSIRLDTASLKGRLTELGRPFGPPWSQDEKFAGLAAWLNL